MGPGFESLKVHHTDIRKGVSSVGLHNAQGPPVPIPNTEVKLCGAENTRLEAVREDRARPTQYSSVAQSVERMTVNHDVTGSSPVRGAIMGQQFCTLTQKSLIFKGFSCF